MGISISLGGILRRLVGAAKPAAAPLNGESVWFEFLTQQDDRVRPSHAALHGTVWRVGDPAAPVPPLDYGCRCGIRYCAAPDSGAANYLPVVKASPAPLAEHYADFLDTKLPTWESIAKVVAKVDQADRLAEAVLLVEKAKPNWTSADVQSYAKMILAAAGGADRG